MVPELDDLWREASEHVNRGNFDKAIEIYKYILIRYGYTRHEWENAVKEYRVALEKEPWNGEYLRALGEAVFNSGDRKTGLEYLHEAAPLYSDNSGFLAEIATAYMSLGDIENARLYAERAVAVRPDDIMALAVLKKTCMSGNGPGNATIN